MIIIELTNITSKKVKDESRKIPEILKKVTHTRTEQRDCQSISFLGQKISAALYVCFLRISKCTGLFHTVLTANRLLGKLILEKKKNLIKKKKTMPIFFLSKNPGVPGTITDHWPACVCVFCSAVYLRLDVFHYADSVDMLLWFQCTSNHDALLATP